MNLKQLTKYRSNYSSSKFWNKLTKYAKSLGKETVYHALLLYYVMIDRKTPWKYKAIIAGALGYLILPLDAIPDAIPFMGFTDDTAAVIAAFKAIRDAITPEIEAKAKEKLSTWF